MNLDQPQQAKGETENRSDAEFALDAPTLFGQLYPKEGILAVVPDRSAAESVEAALVERGVPAEEVQLLSGEQFAEATSHLRQDRNLLERLMALYQQEIDQLMDRYVEQAKAGRVIVLVHTDGDERVDLITSVLAGHVAEMVYYFGALSFRRLN